MACSSSLHDGYAAVLPTFPGSLCLGLVISGGAVQRLDLLAPRASLTSRHPALAQEVAIALAEYFSTATTTALMALPLAPAKTAFGERFRQRLMAIPVACQQSYGQLAADMSTSPRAIGQACRHNPLPLIVPCHRIVASQGPGGYAGHTAGEWLRFKQSLLCHERAHVDG